MRLNRTPFLALLGIAAFLKTSSLAQDKNFHQAPASAKATANPYVGQQANAGGVRSGA